MKHPVVLGEPTSTPLRLSSKAAKKVTMGNLREAFRLADMTATAFAQAATENPVILLPLGSHESHGSHLPMGDFLLADQLAERIAAAASAAGVSTFVAPCLPFGVADYFGSIPGGLALSAQSFRLVLGELLEGLLRHGLTNIIILNGHGGNVAVIHEVTLAIRKQRRLVIPSFYLCVDSTLKRIKSSLRRRQ